MAYISMQMGCSASVLLSIHRLSSALEPSVSILQITLIFWAELHREISHFLYSSFDDDYWLI